MCQKTTLFFFFTFLFLGKIIAQPQPCIDSIPEMTSFCSEACIICDIDGFEGRHESDIPGSAPGELCTFFVHNAQWIAFRAGSTNLSVNMEVSNCTGSGTGGGFGLEMAIFSVTDCTTYSMISNCFGGMTSPIPEGGSGVITTNEPLVIGQYYYIVMDGAGGDNCDWKLTVTEGSTTVDPLEVSGVILGDDTVCPNLPQTYSVDFPIGATEFDWTVNGSPVLVNNDSIEYTFPSDGFYTLCVTSRNACDEAPPNCQTIFVESVPITEIVDILCEGDSLEVANTVIYEGGSYQFNLQNIDGCDSLILVDLTEIVTPILDIDVDICEGDTLFIGDTPFTQTGIYQEILTTINDCDSIVNLDLFTIICNITSLDNPTPAICFGENSGMIEFSVANGTGPFTYTWMELNNVFSGSGNIASVGEIATINNIPKGTYLITIEDNFGNSDIIISEVTEPEQMALDYSASDFNGVNVSCENSNDGSLQVIPSGGVPEYFFIWENNQTTNSINNLVAGNYTVTVSDEVGCTIVGNFEMVAPSPLSVTANFNDPVCEGPNTGVISVSQSFGGIGPYTFSLNNNTFTEEENFENLSQGNYELQMMDTNGCIVSISENLTAPQIPELDLGENLSVNLGDIFTFSPAINNVNLTEILWSPTDGFDCEECLNPSFVPLNSGTYTLVVTSEDDCVESDSLTINVDKFRQFFVPNAFSPNFDGQNDFFTLFGGPEVTVIQKLTIFNRWGAIVFEGKEMTPSVETEGWNGIFNGKDVNPGVYVWMADLRFLDGEVISYSGDVTVVK